MKRLTVLVLALLAAATCRAARPLTVSRFMEMPQAQAEEGQAVVLDGVVTFVSAIETNRFTIASVRAPKQQGVFVLAEPGARMPAEGDVVRVEGRSIWQKCHAVLRATRVDVVRQRELPVPALAKQTDYRRGLLFGRWVALQGKVVEVRHETAPTGVATTRLMLSLDGYEASVIAPGTLRGETYRGQTVRVDGVVGGRYNDAGTLLEPILEVASSADVALIGDRRLTTALIASGVAVGVLLLVLVAVLLVLWQREARVLRENAMIQAERRRMASDLHDTIEQHLAGANLLAAGVLALEDVPPDVAEAMRTLSGLLANAKTEVRDAVMNLWGAGDAERTLDAALGDVVRGLRRTGVWARKAVRGLPDSLPAGVFQDLLLIVREATTNAVKHGRARRIVIVADPLGADGFSLRVANDGAPFEAASALGPETGHFGLSGMRERALRSGLDIAWTRKGRWTIVKIEATTLRGKRRKERGTKT